MNKIIITTQNGTPQHSHLLAVGYADDWDVTNESLSAYISDSRQQNFQYVHIQDVAAYWFWYENLTSVPIETLCQIASQCNREGHNLLKGWAALMLLTEDPVALSNDELLFAIEAAEAHNGLMRHNALQILQRESDDRELGYQDYYQF